jgi:prepilin-type N-terminal cleavage/methylation domain-containing protein/prepilin-type processing-associated H-X9-DG protein
MGRSNMSRRNGCVHNLHGFTLIELLVVISIIALLLSILLPTLSRVKQTAYRVVCASNLKEINIASALWSIDHDDWVLHSEWAEPDENLTFNNGLESYTGTNWYEGKLYRCPGVPRTQKDQGDISFCYGINRFMVSEFDPFTNSRVSIKGRGGIKRSKIKFPSERVYFMDSTTTSITVTAASTPISDVQKVFFTIDAQMLHQSTYSIGTQAIEYHTTPHRGSTPVRMGDDIVRSKGLANVGWVDGHASIEPKDFRSLEWINSRANQYYFIGRNSDGTDEP